MKDRGDFTDTTVMATIPCDHMPTGDLRVKEEASLILLSGPSAGVRIALTAEALTIGRDPSCGLQVLAQDVSREHASVRHAPEGYWLEDHDSRNGTWINGRPVKRQLLRVGQRIRFGTSVVALFTHHDDLQDEILHKQKLESLGRLAGGVAHDFNNLLGAVLQNTCYLMEDLDALPRDEVQATLEDIRSAAVRAADLTRQLLGFARKGKYETVSTCVNELVEDVLRILSRTIAPSVKVDFEAEQSHWVLGDRSQLHQVLLNLCINARDAMPDGGTLTVRISKRHDHVMIEVRDTGMGMPPHVRERVFEPFFTTKEVGQGTGLGLATAYGVIKNHGGEIQLNTAVGVGTTFEIFLPRHAGPERRTTEPRGTSSTSPGRISRGTILVVDDEELHRRGCARVLRQSGYDVLTAQDGPEAIRVFESHKSELDVVLLDLRMPGMAGDEVARHILAIDQDARLIAMSGYTDARRAGALLEGTSAAFLRKPYTTGALEDAVQRAMRQATAVCRAG